MLNLLVIKNLVLVEEARVAYEKGLTIITGETGAGKTALIEALRLIFGQRSDPSKVRKGCDKALVQASFSWDSSYIPLLEDIGLDFQEEEDLIISREITSSGKSRAFVSGQMIPASFLQRLAPLLVDFVGQHAQVSLKNGDTQRDFLDLYAGVDCGLFQTLWKEEKSLQETLENCLRQKEANTRRKKLLEEHLAALEEANILEGEDEALFAEYGLLSNSQEVLGKIQEILTGTDEINGKCFRYGSLIDELIQYDKSLSEAKEMIKEAHLQMEELRIRLQSLSAKMECDPNRLTFLEDRLKEIDRLKKAYGEDLIVYQKEISEELLKMDTLDDRIPKLHDQLARKREETRKASQMLSEMRQRGAKKLAPILSQTLEELNMKGAIVGIECSPKERTSTGEDQITFTMKANIGEQSALVKDSSSGGELSRLLFALKLALADKDGAQTMIFDEIDANVGGKAASIIGEKLKELGKQRQVICITHFPQVARHGDHHLRVYKEEIDGRTIGKIESLDKASQEAELLRMLGGQSFTQTT